MSIQVVLITGALTGSGRATAVAFAKSGADVVISGRHIEAGQKLAAELRGLGTEAEFVQADVRRESDVQKLIDHTMSRFGRLDAAVNNTGTEGKPGPFESGVRINVVAPGPIETGMLNRFTSTPENKADLISRVPMKRIGQPEEVAAAILSWHPTKLPSSPGYHSLPTAESSRAEQKEGGR